MKILHTSGDKFETDLRYIIAANCPLYTYYMYNWNCNGMIVTAGSELTSLLNKISKSAVAIYIPYK